MAGVLPRTHFTTGTPKSTNNSPGNRDDLYKSYDSLKNFDG